VRERNRLPVGGIVIGPLGSLRIALRELPAGLEKHVFAPGGMEKSDCKNADDWKKSK
jgi:hypothetical protein